MGKAETVAKYIDEYLKGKNPESAEKFRMKDVEKQYAATMRFISSAEISGALPISTRACFR